MLLLLYILSEVTISCFILEYLRDPGVATTDRAIVPISEFKGTMSSCTSTINKNNNCSSEQE